MGRKPRVHYEGAAYHAVSRGVEKRFIFERDDDKSFFRDHLKLVCRESGADLHSYCVMGNHFHAAIQVEKVPLSEIMHRVKTVYAKRINQRGGRVGHLFENRYGAWEVRTEPHLIQLIRYIHDNPVRAGLVKTAAEWEWSSAREYLAEGRDPMISFDSDLPKFDDKPFDPYPKKY